MLNKSILNLHSNMDRLKRNRIYTACRPAAYLHSNMDRLKPRMQWSKRMTIAIYIPIWID